MSDSQHPDRETITLSFPVNAAYVSAARLTASSIANRMGFDIDEIEDVKAAVSEACTYLIKKNAPGGDGVFGVDFQLEGGELEIHITSGSFLAVTAGDGDMGLMMIKALMDQLTLEPAESGKTVIVMRKTHKPVLFE